MYFVSQNVTWNTNDELYEHIWWDKSMIWYFNSIHPKHYHAFIYVQKACRFFALCKIWWRSGCSLYNEINMLYSQIIIPDWCCQTTIPSPTRYCTSERFGYSVISWHNDAVVFQSDIFVAMSYIIYSYPLWINGKYHRIYNLWKRIFYILLTLHHLFFRYVNQWMNTTW